MPIMGGKAEVSLIPFGILVFLAAVIEGVVALLFQRRLHRFASSKERIEDVSA